MGGGAKAETGVAGEGGVAEVYLLGGHVTSYRPAGEEDVLWLSEASHFEVGKAIREKLGI